MFQLCKNLSGLFTFLYILFDHFGHCAYLSLPLIFITEVTQYSLCLNFTLGEDFDFLKVPPDFASYPNRLSAFGSQSVGPLLV